VQSGAEIAMLMKVSPNAPRLFENPPVKQDHTDDKVESSRQGAGYSRIFTASPNEVGCPPQRAEFLLKKRREDRENSQTDVDLVSQIHYDLIRNQLKEAKETVSRSPSDQLLPNA
jgi:hypothetical protein